MPCQVHAPASHSHPKTHEDADRKLEEDAEVQAAQARSAEVEATLEMTDDLLAEIDEALGDTLGYAQEFVSNFVQKSGQ